ncbi:autophagy-related protein 7 [Dothidotthia symphoricarpi CBS 119687]|uniref:Ubiquitin-like modifier-activating enzyme ATG7 n=1 Tax=Dothidotthia symphoricarpi CBS 119687 TaxID=1392245 RepID=A0A6A6A0W0_9PLEO|nr:autophagy-related protein 7 [Dothidotthia symphoricarpi CBS 119687]KAF2124191.1 autophagy-related protein 7 [Dothidotthia symphoricarpi CBS 119687]
MATLIKYAPFMSDVDMQFYAALAHIKINHDKLDDSARKVLGLYEVRPGDHPSRSMRAQIYPNALTSDETPPNYYRAEGIIKNCNTIEDYKNLDRAAVLERCAQTIWEAIHDGSIYECPSLLSSFTTIIFANLKKYKFTYHFGFPAIQSDPQWKRVGEATRFDARETTYLVDAVQTWKYSSDARQRGFFLAKRVRGTATDDVPKTPVSPLEEFGYQWVIGRLGKFEKGFFDGVDKEDRFISFADPSTYADNPGWPLRNLLVLMRQRWHLSEAQILCYRDTHTRRDQPNSLILQIQSDPGPPASTATSGELSARPRTPKLPKVTGWERTESGKLTSRNVDLSEYMDERKLADQAVDLNLKLIKWRIAPNIDLDVIKNTKCLLLGAGTLGSYVSRTLMGWGVRKITFVDNATVSFSNPVRQPLFDFKDCLKGGVLKAERAAEALEEIYPGVDAAGHVMEVPMAGHPITDAAKTKANFEKLEQLIDQHDVIFLLMDTRESRWLPTVMGKAKGKIVLNAALGFDTFVVMRHGLRTTQEGEVELGCYFCNDVVAPADSLSNATLDQQCTVTRPGIAPLASSLLVELLVSILQHPSKSRAPPPSHTQKPTSSKPSSSHPALPPPFEHPLGTIPHTIRGYLSTFSNLQVEGQPYDCCSACSDTVIQCYEKDPWGFVQKALNEKGWVEEMSGLAEVQRRADEASKDVEWDSEDEGGLEDEGEIL